MRHVDHLDRLNFDQFKVSVKASDASSLLSLIVCWQNRLIQPLHLGITEAGGARSGAVNPPLV